MSAAGRASCRAEVPADGGTSDTEVAVAHLGPRTHQRPTKPTCRMRSRKRVQQGCREPQRAWQRPARASKGASYTSVPSSHSYCSPQDRPIDELRDEMLGQGLITLFRKPAGLEHGGPVSQITIFSGFGWWFLL